MRVLFADAVGESTVTELEARGHTCVVDAGLKAGDLPSSLDGFDALVVRSTKVGREVFENADRLALVIRAGAGTNTIDTGAAAARGVLVANLPGRNAVAVAELTMGLLLAVDRRIVDGTVDLRAGRWDKKTYGAARGLFGSTIGILGLGSIGLEVAQRARAFGMDVLALAKPDRSEHVRARAEDLHIGMAESLSELLPACDVVSLHLPSGPATVGLVDRSFLGQMKPRVHPAEHLAGRPRRRGRAARGARRPGPPRRARRVRRRARVRSGRVDLPARPAPAGGRHPPHRGLHPAGPGRHRRGRGGGHRRLRPGRDAQLRQPHAQPDRLRHPHGAPPGPGRRPRPRPGPAEPGPAQRRAHAEPGLPWRGRRGGDDRRRPGRCRTTCSPTWAPCPTSSGSPRPPSTAP